MEEVILVDERDTVTGVMEKITAHEQGALHRAISVFVFNYDGALLLQQRAMQKYHSGGLWTNTCCSHPRPGEDTVTAAARRLKEEMGFETPLEKVLDFTYRTVFDNGLTEYEFDHVFAGYYDGPVWPDIAEVSDHAYVPMQKIAEMMQHDPTRFTAWFHIAFPKVMEWWQRNQAA